jgi:hypothetical protein
VILAVETEVWTALIGAGAALVGIVLGGLIAIGTTAYFERKRESAEFRQARRLVAGELRMIWAHLIEMLDAGTTPITPGSQQVFLATDLWRESAPTLARNNDVVSDAGWDQLSALVSVVELHRALLVSKPPGTPLTQSETDNLRDALEYTHRCYATLTDGRQLD